MSTLRNSEFLAGLPDAALAGLAEKTELLRYEGEEAVITLGEHGSTMYFIISGSVRVHDGDIELARLEKGEVFGEVALLDADVRSASVTTENDSLLLCLERDDLFAAMSQCPDSYRALLKAILHRERNIVHDVKTRSKQLLAYEKEMEIGRRIQADFLPERIPEIENWEIASWFEAAREVAGDFYDVFQLDCCKRVALVIGDVCDKGVGAALFMTLFRSLIRASTLFGSMHIIDSRPDDAKDGGDSDAILINAINATNNYVANTHSRSSMFASVFFGLLDPNTGALTYINAGHEAPIIFRHDGSHEVLETTGGVIGLFPGARFGLGNTRLEPGDLLFSYTDGVNEAKNEANELFGEERINQAKDGGDVDPETLVSNMIEAIKAFRGSAAQFDDITMLAAKFLSRPDNV